MKRHILCGLFATACLLTSRQTATAQTAALAADTLTAMQQEAEQFVRHMPAGLQDRQTQAIRDALDGRLEPLQAVRQARNTDHPLPDGVRARYVAPHLRLYTPDSASTGNPLPLLVYLHGGGWTFGSIQSCARFCATLAQEASCLVLAVDYRLAPEHPYPAPLDDCCQAAALAHAHAREWGADPTRISIGGDSSGGNLALATALRRQREGQPPFRSLVLFYPVVKAWNDASDSWQRYQTGAALDGSIMDAFNEAYCQGKQNAEISPAMASDDDLAQLPPTLLIAAERDILYDQGQAFARRLAGLGVQTTHLTFPATVHLFITVAGQDCAFRQAVRQTTLFLHK